QLACADLVLLTKTDLVKDTELNKIKTWLSQELRPGVKVVSCHHGQINPDILLGFNAAVEDNLESRPSHHDQEEEHDHDDDINSVQITLEQAYEPKTLVTTLTKLVQDNEIYRIKGFVHVPNKPMRLVLQGVGDRFDTFYDRLWRNDEAKQTRLVFIGRELKQQTIENQLITQNQSS
ncbi:MAG: GTP-binding protein, partial [Crocosphaera sp.]